MFVNRELLADRQRIKEIVALPEAQKNLLPAIHMAIAGATVADVKLMLAVAPNQEKEPAK